MLHGSVIQKCAEIEGRCHLFICRIISENITPKAFNKLLMEFRKALSRRLNWPPGLPFQFGVILRI
jgi:hypothetical protein